MSDKPRVLVVYGTRPEAIKVAPVILALRDSALQGLTLTTGQHPHMVQQVKQVFGITADYSIDVMRPGQSLNALAARVLEGLDQKLQQIQPDAVLVQGDTTTVMAAALAAFNRGVKVAHLEAGLRSGNLQLPFPEEANRRLAGQVTSLHLAPTAGAKTNLLLENVDPALVTAVPINLPVDVEGPTRGRTIGDVNRLNDPRKTSRVALGVDVDRFLEEFMSRITSRLRAH